MATGVVQQAAIPNDWQAEATNIARQRAYAEALMQQGLAPQGDTKMVGPLAVKNPLTAGFAQLAKAYLGRKGTEDADAKMTALGGRFRDAQAEALLKFNNLTTGTPGKPEQLEVGPSTDEPGQPGIPATPAIPPNSRAASQFAAASQFPVVQAMGAAQAAAYAKLLEGGARNATTPSVIAAADSGGDINKLVGKQDVVVDQGIPLGIDKNTPTGQPTVKRIGAPWQDTTVKGADGKDLPAQTNPLTGMTDVKDKGVRVTTNVDTKGSSALAQNLGKQSAEDFTVIAKAGRDAPTMYQTSDRIEKLAETAGTGITAQPKMWADKILAAFNASSGTKAASLEQLTTDLRSSTLKMAKSMPGSLSDKDVEFLTGATGSIASEPATLIRVARIAKIAAVNAYLLHQDAFNSMATADGVTPQMLSPYKPITFPIRMSGDWVGDNMDGLAPGQTPQLRYKESGPAPAAAAPAAGGVDFSALPKRGAR
jgi:hypothetical protein